MANLNPDGGSDLDAEAQRQAKLDAMRRASAMGSTIGGIGAPAGNPLATTSPAPMQSPDAASRNTDYRAQGAALAAAANASNPNIPRPGGLTSTIGGLGAASGNPLATTGSAGTVSQGPDAIARAAAAATGGSLGPSLVPPASTIPGATSPDAASHTASGPTAAPYTGPTADQMAAIAKALADANAANAARNQTGTTGGTTGGGVVQPQPPQPPQPPVVPPVVPPIKPGVDNNDIQTAMNAGFGQKVVDTSGSGGTTGTDATAVGPGPGIQDQTGGAGTGPGGSGGNQGGDLGSITNQLMGQIQNIGSTLANPGTPSDVTGVFLTQAQSILSMLDQQEAQLRAESEKNGTTVDPSTQFTIDKLRENLTENLKTVREDLNRRGLNDSGISLELENKLRTGSQSDQAKILADRLTTLQQQLQQGLTANRAAKYSTLSTFGMGAANAQQQHNENQYKSADDREQAALQAMLGLRGQVNNSSISAADNASALQRALLQEQGQNSRAAATTAEDARQYNETFGMNKAKYNQDFAYNAQNDALNRAASGAKAAAAVTQINNPYGGNTKTPGVDAATTNAAIGAISNATSRTQAQADLFKSAQKLIDAGVDLTAVQDAINAKFPPSAGDRADEYGKNRSVGGSV